MSRLSPERLSQLLRERGAALVLYARQWCRCPEDVVQEAFLELIEQPTEPANVVAWLYRVVRHRALNASRSATRRTRRESLWRCPTKRGSNRPVNAGRRGKRGAPRVAADEREVIVARLRGGLCSGSGQLTARR